MLKKKASCQKKEGLIKTLSVCVKQKRALLCLY